MVDTLTVTAAGETATVDLTLERFPGDPGSGRLYYGESTGKPSPGPGGDPSLREQTYGMTVGNFRSYFTPATVATLPTVAKRDLLAGRLPIQSSHTPDTWANMGNGTQDRWIDTIMTGLDALPGPAWLCLDHEPTDDVAAKGSAADFKSMCRRLMLRKADNVAIIPILQSFPFDRSTGGTANILDWVDDDTCDIRGLDAYNHWSLSPTDPTKTVNRWRTVEDVFSVATQGGLSKPVAYCEWGVRTDPAHPGKAAKWMSDARTFLVGLGNIVAMAYFDSGLNVNDGGTTWSLADERLTQFALDLRNPANARLVLAA